MDPLINRMIRASKLDIDLYEEVERDEGAIYQAFLVVVFSSLAAGIGSARFGHLNAIVLGTILSIIGWLIWAYLTYFIGTRLLPEPQTEADYGQLLRTIGFASSPGIIRILGLIPPIANLIFIIAGIWSLMAMVVAVRQALDYKSTLRALIVCLIGWIVQGLFIGLLLYLFRLSPRIH